MLRNNYSHGMSVTANSFPTVTNCAFTNNGERAVEGLALAAVPGFTNNTATGNVGNFMSVTSATITAPLTIGSQSILEGALMMSANLNVQPSGTLVVEQGVNFKFTAAYEVVVDGSMHLRGTSYEPIVFTDDADDSVAGDTNNNGPSIGSPTSWRGITILPTALYCPLEHVVIRYTGSAFVPALTCSSPQASLRCLRADHAYDRGFVLNGLSSTPTNLVAWACGGFGVQLVGGNFQVAHATCAGNGTGIRRENAWSGLVLNSNSYGNTTNFANFGAGAQVATSNGGFAGVNGNLNLNPQFLNQAQGDLHLGSSSPCLGNAEVLAAFFAQKDFDENSRLLDHALIGLPLPDMGAFEYSPWNMTVTGVARPGSVITYTMTGPPAESLWVLGALDGTTAIIPYGMLLSGAVPGQSDQDPRLQPRPVLLADPREFQPLLVVRHSMTQLPRPAPRLDPLFCQLRRCDRLQPVPKLVAIDREQLATE